MLNILCNICSELLNNNDDIAVTHCGHAFHRSPCLSTWLNNSKTCPTCRHVTYPDSLIKVFFENEQSKINDLHNDLMKNIDNLNHELKDLKLKYSNQNAVLQNSIAKNSEFSEKIKELERVKQLDDMTLVGLRSIREESAKEIVKLNQEIATIKLDLLAEKQLRRIHQTTLHQLDPTNEIYDTKSITTHENAYKPSDSYSISPWQLRTDDKTITEKKEHNYIVPNKIQKATHNTQIQMISKFPIGNSNNLNIKNCTTGGCSFSLPSSSQTEALNFSNNLKPSFIFGNNKLPSESPRPFQFGSKNMPSCSGFRALANSSTVHNQVIMPPSVTNYQFSHSHTSDDDDDDGDARNKSLENFIDNTRESNR